MYIKKKKNSSSFQQLYHNRGESGARRATLEPRERQRTRAVARRVTEGHEGWITLPSRELRVLRRLNGHQNIVTLYDIVPPRQPKQFTELTLIFEFVEADLGKIFRTNQWFTSLHVQYMLYQILSGVKYIHSMNIAHGDLKPSNILINEDCSIKISNFNRAYQFDPTDDELFVDKDKGKSVIKTKDKKDLDDMIEVGEKQRSWTGPKGRETWKIRQVLLYVLEYML